MPETSHTLEFDKPLKKYGTPIPGLMVFDLEVRGDSRGWFKENWQREKMTKLGLPDFGPVQNNISFNTSRGVTRGIHAEAWDKFISIGAGRIFGAWVDLREGDTFGNTFTCELDPSKAIFVPAGVANAYQALEEHTVYSYLVNDYWYPDAQYVFLNLRDETANIQWPIPLDEVEISEKDKHHPYLSDIAPMKPKKILVFGGNGQVGKALRAALPNAEYVDIDEFDIRDEKAYEKYNWREYQTIINAAAYTNVDEAEHNPNIAWSINATAVGLMAKTATEYGLTLVHISTDYVFSLDIPPHPENEAVSPKGVYASSKAAGDLALASTPKHYLLRTSWVVGEGKNFVRTMKTLAEKGAAPSVVGDQTGRLSFASDIAAAIKHLLDKRPEYGIYNFSNDGDVVSWAEIASEVYALVGSSREDVSAVTTEEYFADKPNTAPRPFKSELNIDKMKATGFAPRDWRTALKEYIESDKE